MNIETANRLFQYRKKHNLSQEELAEKIGVSRQAISKWERAEASPDTDNLIILAKIYGVTLDELLQGESEPQVKENNEETFDESEESIGAGEPDPDTNYVAKDKVSFKNGIHVHEKDGDQVDISFKDGIHVDAKDGTKVHIDRHGIHVKENEKTRVYTDEKGNVMVDEEMEQHHKHHKKTIAHMFPMWLVSIIAFFLWGFSGLAYGFALSWICFLAIPIYHSLVDAIVKRNPTHFAYPVLCVAAYMVMGFFGLGIYNGWAVGWLVFITIPFYYFVANMINHFSDKKSNTEDCE